MRNTVSLIFFVLFTNGLIIGCTSDKGSLPEPAEEAVLNDVAYGKGAAQKMDVYLPKNRDTSTMVIIYIHGGGWYQGDKSEIKSGAVYFQQQGMAFISLNYRLTRTGENFIHPAQMEDIESAVAVILSKSAGWKISANNLAFWGGSAGAHLAMLYGYKYNTGKKIKAIIATSGPTDFTDTALINGSIGGERVNDMITSFIGQSFSANPQGWRDASPINYISASSVPTFFMHGTIDVAVPYQQSVNAFQKLQQAGVPAFLEPLEGMGHNLDAVNWAFLIPKIFQFVKTYAR